VDLASKLQLKPGQRVESLLVPESVASDITEFACEGDDHQEAGLLVFAAERATLEEYRLQIVEAVNQGRLTWVSYPKSGQLGTDLNRDSLAALLAESGIQPVRQIAIDAVWSALRFRTV
jgi:hypothetical protein